MVKPADFLTILLLVALEGLLSADNAMVLAVLVLGLPKHEQRKALRYGIIGAFAFRAVATLTAAYLIQLGWVKLVGAAYLMYLAIHHFMRSLILERLGNQRRMRWYAPAVGLPAVVSVTPGGTRMGWRMKLDDGVPNVKADPSSIEQIVINLAVNARDAMPEGGSLTIGTSLQELDESFAALHPGAIAGRYVSLEVSDTGAGMDAPTRDRIFEPFFTTKEQGKGSGLGLATVYGLVKQSGGYIWVDSAPGAGSVFKVYFPPIDREAEPVQDARSNLSGSETVLLVEDEDTVRALAGEVLRRNGYAVLEARHSLEALRLVERHQESIDLMITDIVMSHMTGRDLAERIREGRPSMKILFISGYIDHASVQRELAAGMPFLQKPFTPEAFARKVRNVLDDSITTRLR